MIIYLFYDDRFTLQQGMLRIKMGCCTAAERPRERPFFIFIKASILIYMCMLNGCRVGSTRALYSLHLCPDSPSLLSGCATDLDHELSCILLHIYDSGVKLFDHIRSNLAQKEYILVNRIWSNRARFCSCNFYTIHSKW